MTRITAFQTEEDYIYYAMEKVVYRKILVTYDGSELASSAFSHAVALALACDAEALLLQVVNSVEQESALMSSPGIGIFPAVATAGSAAFIVVKENKRRAKQQLKKFKADFEASGVKNLKIYIEEGLAQDVIVDVAKMEHCDLIVMSTHGHSGLGRVLLGSVADHVIRHAICPVLVVHPKRGGE